MEWMQEIELIAATLGILYLWLEIRASIWLWLVGIILPLFYIYISWSSQVYGNVIVNLYYMIACIIGWISWYRRRGEAEQILIRWAPWRTRLFTLCLTLLFISILSSLMSRFMGSPFPIWDAIATAVSLVGMWLLAKAYVETWYCWILSNAIYCALFFVQDFTTTGIYFIIYTIFSFIGFFRWYRKASQAQSV